MLRLILIFSLLSSLLAQVIPQSSLLNGNNVCKQWSDYYQMTTSRNCWYNADYTDLAPNLIKKYSGASFEEYNVTTDDGYFLTIFRMKRENPKGVMLLVPTMFMDAHLFLIQGNQSTALHFWREGYDIWFYNQRGTRYSEGHVNMSTADYEYWNFSFDEIGRYDLSKVIKTVKNITNSKMFVYGTSMASTVSLIYASLLPGEAEDGVESFILAGNSAFFQHATSISVTMVPQFEPVLKELSARLRIGNIFPAIETILMILRLFYRNPVILLLNHIMFLMIFGWTYNEADPAILSPDVPAIMRDMPWKLAIHYLQIQKTKSRFQSYDYGREGNERNYGTILPPEYPLKKISVPVFLIISDGDTLTSLKDAEYLYNSALRKPAKVYRPIYISKMNHGDYHYGVHRKERLLDKIVQFMERVRNK